MTKRLGIHCRHVGVYRSLSYFGTARDEMRRVRCNLPPDHEGVHRWNGIPLEEPT